MFLIITSSLSVESAGFIVDFAFNLKVNMLLSFNSGNEKKMAKTVRHRLAEHLKKRKKYSELYGMVDRRKYICLVQIDMVSTGTSTVDLP